MGGVFSAASEVTLSPRLGGGEATRARDRQGSRSLAVNTGFFRIEEAGF